MSKSKALHVTSETDCGEDQRKGLRVCRLGWYFPNREGWDTLLLGTSVWSGWANSDPVLHRRPSSVWGVKFPRRCKEKEAELDDIPANESQRLKELCKKITGCKRDNRRGADLKGRNGKCQTVKSRFLFVLPTYKRCPSIPALLYGIIFLHCVLLNKQNENWMSFLVEKCQENSSDSV